MTDGFLGRIPAHWRSLLHLDHNSQLYGYFLGKFALQSFFSTAVAALNDWVSRANASWYTRNREEVSQEILIKMVRAAQPSRIVLA
jgi:hypothetical protein